MVSKRNFFIIIIMMLVLLFVFQFSQLAKEELSTSYNNEYLQKDMPDSTASWTGESSRKMVYVGKDNGKVQETVEKWCKYIKAELVCSNTLPSYSEVSDASMVLIDAANLDTDSYMNTIYGFTDKGITVVFCSLPTSNELKNCYPLCKLLGITKIPQTSVKLEGIRVFEGVFVGGEVIYKIDEDETDREKIGYQDLDLNIPWYVTAEGSKSYIVGMLDANMYAAEQFPRIVWRYTGDYTSVFAVNGDYMSTDAGLGLLDLFLYESNDYALYPIVNAQSTVVVDLLAFTNENEQTILERYSRQLEIATQDIFMPGVISLTTRNNLVPTFMMMTRYDFATEATTDLEELPAYIRQVNNLSGEAGISLRAANANLSQKMTYDMGMLSTYGDYYNFRAAYVDNCSEIENVDINSKIGTVVAKGGVDEVFYYLNNTVTVQQITADATGYSFSDDFTQRSLNSALGYMSLEVDFHNVIWSDNDNYGWEGYFDIINSNISTYWRKLNVFQNVTVSESDRRIRRFLALNYEESCDENGVITLNVIDGNKDCYFLLRTHDKVVADIKNADYAYIDDDSVLIHVLDDSVTIRLEDSEDVLTYSEPFTR